MEMIEVKVQLTESVSAPVAAQLCEDFLEWIDGQRWNVAPNLAMDERDYEDLAVQFVAERSQESR